MIVVMERKCGKLALAIDGVDGCIESATITLRPPCPEMYNETHYVHNGSACGGVTEVIINNAPRLEYPLFEVSDVGEVVFYFDDKIESLPLGRFTADILINNTQTTCIEIQLVKPKAVVTGATTHTHGGNTLC